MKKYISVFSLIAKNSIYQIAGLLLLLVAVDSALAWYYLFVRSYGLSTFFQNGTGRLGMVLAVIFVLIAVVQIRRGDIYSGPQGYTMRRLVISEKAVAVLQILYNLLCWLILWGVQVLTVFVICKIYYTFGADAGDPLVNQQIFLLFYISPLLHSLLPMEDVLAWVANVVMVVELSVASAHWAVLRREKKSGVHLWGGYWPVILIFRRELGSFVWNMLIIVAFLIMLGIECYRMFFAKQGGGDRA